MLSFTEVVSKAQYGFFIACQMSTYLFATKEIASKIKFFREHDIDSMFAVMIGVFIYNLSVYIPIVHSVLIISSCLYTFRTLARRKRI